MPGETLSLKCACGYIKHDVMHLGVWHDRQNRLLKFCGGLFLVDENGEGASCKKCSTTTNTIEFFCAFCSRTTTMPVSYRVAKIEGRATVVQMSVHKTVVFSVQSNWGHCLIRDSNHYYKWTLHWWSLFVFFWVCVYMQITYKLLKNKYTQEGKQNLQESGLERSRSLSIQQWTKICSQWVCQ